MATIRHWWLYHQYSTWCTTWLQIVYSWLTILSLCLKCGVCSRSQPGLFHGIFTTVPPRQMATWQATHLAEINYYICTVHASHLHNHLEQTTKDSIQMIRCVIVIFSMIHSNSRVKSKKMSDFLLVLQTVSLIETDSTKMMPSKSWCHVNQKFS